MQENKLKDFTSFRLSKSTVFKQKYKKYLFERHLFSYLIVRQKTATSYQRNLKYILRLVIQTEIKCSFLHFCKIESIMPADLFWQPTENFPSHATKNCKHYVLVWFLLLSFFFAILFLSETHSSYFHWKEDEEGQTSSLFQLSSLCFLGMQKNHLLSFKLLEFFPKSCVGFFSA